MLESKYLCYISSFAGTNFTISLPQTSFLVASTCLFVLKIPISLHLFSDFCPTFHCHAKALQSAQWMLARAAQHNSGSPLDMVEFEVSNPWIFCWGSSIESFQLLGYPHFRKRTFLGKCDRWHLGMGLGMFTPWISGFKGSDWTDLRTTRITIWLWFQPLQTFESHLEIIPETRT